MPQTLKFSQPSRDDDSASTPTDSAEAAQRDAAQQDEANMRRALGMLGGPARQQPPSGAASRDRRPSSTPVSSTPRRHRFVQDGDVPVTVMRTRPDPAAETAQTGVGSPVNRLEAMQASLATERTARERAERLLEEAIAANRDLQTKVAHLELAREEALNAPAPAPVMAAATQAVEIASVPDLFGIPGEKPPRRTRGPGKRQLQARETKPEKEQQPVKWWVRTRVKKPDAKPTDDVTLLD